MIPVYYFLGHGVSKVFIPILIAKVLMYNKNKHELLNDKNNLSIKTIQYSILTTFFFTIIVSIAILSSSTLCDTEITPPVSQFDLNLPKAETKAPTHTHNQRMRKPREKKTKKSRTYMHMDYDELVAAKNVQKANKNMSATIKYLDQLLKLCTDINLLAEHLSELAVVLFDDAQFTKAALLYLQYYAHYPGSDTQEYSLYRAIMSSLACTLSVDRDQSKTEETLVLTEQFLQQDHFTVYKTEVLNVQMQCYERLALSECNICRFYLTQGKLTAAEKRLKDIRSQWLIKIPTLEPQILMMETELLEQKEKATATTIKQTKLAQNKTAKHMADRF